jgi:cellobiose phosphorylase
MASRYTYSKTLTKKDTKKMYLSSVIYPKIKASDDDMYIISDAGDRLDISWENGLTWRDWATTHKSRNGIKFSFFLDQREYYLVPEQADHNNYKSR